MGKYRIKEEGKWNIHLPQKHNYALIFAFASSEYLYPNS